MPAAETQPNQPKRETHTMKFAQRFLLAVALFGIPAALELAHPVPVPERVSDPRKRSSGGPPRR